MRRHAPGDEGADAQALRDETLALEAAAGDDDAFTELYARYADRLYGYCWSILRDDANAQDVLQSTWLNALVALREARRTAPVRPWLFRIAHNESISMLRRLDGAGRSIESPGPAPSAEEQALRRERLHEVLADLQALPERTRGALVMRELCGLTHAEIALVLGTTVGAAKQSIREARRELQDFVAGRETACTHIRTKISLGDRRLLQGRSVRAHLRHCPRCSAFSDAVQGRRGGLAALIPPLAPLATERVLSAVLRHGARHHGLAAGAGASSAGSVLAGTGAGGAGAGGAGAGGAGAGGAGAGGATAAGGLAAAGGTTAIGAAGKAAGTAVLGKVLAAAAIGSVAVVAAGIDRPVAGRHPMHRRSAAAPETAAVTRRARPTRARSSTSAGEPQPVRIGRRVRAVHPAAAADPRPRAHRGPAHPAGGHHLPPAPGRGSAAGHPHPAHRAADHPHPGGARPPGGPSHPVDPRPPGEHPHPAGGRRAGGHPRPAGAPPADRPHPRGPVRPSRRSRRPPRIPRVYIAAPRHLAPGRAGGHAVVRDHRPPWRHAGRAGSGAGRPGDPGRGHSGN